MNQTFQWIQDNIKDEIDFVIWTGDSARHDNDEKLPRTRDQIIDQNEFMVSKFVEVFGQPSPGRGPGDFVIPIVPTFGNNDIMPHNIFTTGPNAWTMKYLDIWRGFIPEAQRHQFQQGGWFSVEVIPGKLAAISLNTMCVTARRPYSAPFANPVPAISLRPTRLSTAAQRNTSPATNTWNGCASSSSFCESVA